MKIKALVTAIYEKLSQIKLKDKLRLMLLVILVPMFLLTFFYYGRFMLQLHNDIERRYKNAEESVKKAFDFYKSGLIVAAKLIGEDEKIKYNITRSGAFKLRQKELREQLNYMQKLAKIQYAEIYNKNGDLLAGGERTGNSKIINERENPLIKSALAGESIYTIEYYDDCTLFIKVAVPIYESHGNTIIGVSVAGIKNRKDLTPVFASLIQAISGVDILVIAEKDFITTSFGIQLNDYKMLLTPELEQIRVNGIRYDLKFINLWPVHYIPDFGVAIAVDNSSIRSTMFDTMILMLLSFIGISLVSYFISNFIAREILHKTQSLMIGTEKIAQQDFSYRIPERGSDELSQLGKTFNLMTCELSEFLEEVRKKNKELSTFNEITKQISYSLDFHQVFDQIVEYLISIYSFEGVALSLVDAGFKNYKVEILKNYMPEMTHKTAFQGISFPLDIEKGGRIAQTILEKRHFFFSNVQYDGILNPINRQAAEFLKINSALNIPILVGEEVIGAFTMMTYTKTINLNDEDIESIKRFINQISVILRNTKLHQELEQKKNLLLEKDKVIREDLFMAKKIQENILPKYHQHINGLEFYVQYQPHSDIGGDLYDIFEMSDDTVRVFLADATGHGIQASLTTMLIKSEYEKIKQFEIPVNKVLKSLNHAILYQYYHLNLFFNCVILDINTQKRTIQYSSAGHPSQIMIRDDELVMLEGSGKLIGMVEKSDYQIHTQTFMPRDKILLFTDGLIEEFNAAGEELGEEGLKAILRRYVHKDIPALGKAVLRDVRHYLGSSALNDDLTMIGIGFSE